MTASTITSKTTAPTNTFKPTTTTNTPQTVASTSTSKTTFSTSTSKTPTGTPTAPSAQPGITNVIINANNPQITRSDGWTFGKSSCDPAQVSLKTNIADQWLTFITAANATASIYVDISSDQASLEMFVDGKIINASHSSSENCQYQAVGTLNQTGRPHNVTISIPSGFLSSSSPFEFNSFAFGEQSLASTADRIGPGGITVAAAAFSAIVMFLI
ncbi:hypothetical protein M378DRAFT_166870 [Amanita muscaria Koide BX008]|uniref:Uncharacterized protein n=1 Tax=Amanita muscaria (strain Koide BX008) TaxID=946122 RepID=A0A0C2WYE7_AMAMK|nr:hypothetical protein M378DRAFT_166870 [Amanita muscaria Koide BX008]